RQFFKSYGETYEIIMVDDGSDEKTANQLNFIQLESEKAHHNDIEVIHLKQNVGQQKAIVIGLTHASGEYAVTIDDDLQHDIGELKGLYEAALSGADLVFGIYSDYGEKNSRALGSKMIGWFFRVKFKKLCGMRVSSYRLIHFTVFKNMVCSDNRFVYVSAELLPYAHKVDNVIVNRRIRAYGKSGYTLMKCVKIGIQLFLNYGLRPSNVKKGAWMISENITHGRRG
ncbi:MAG TPA: hypothetical protein DCS67_08315, partial [Clostridiales bacterium UBA8960]|nr:hypothetical protein [Clostridiales bacterium UBA8960]